MQVLESILLTYDWDPTNPTGVYLNGANGDGYFGGIITGLNFCLSTDTCIDSWSDIGGWSSAWSISWSDVYYIGWYVGVGRSNPQYPLHVDWSTKIEWTLLAQEARFGTPTNNWYNLNVAGGANINDNVYISGNEVGIWTSTPQVPLEVATVDEHWVNMRLAHWNSWIRFMTSGGNTAYNSLTQTGDNGIFWWSTIDADAGYNGFVIGSHSASAKWIRIDSWWNVGIWISTPTYKFDVNGTGNFLWLCLGSECISSWAGLWGGWSSSPFVADTYGYSYTWNVWIWMASDNLNKLNVAWNIKLSGTGSIKYYYTYSDVLESCSPGVSQCGCDSNEFDSDCGGTTGFYSNTNLWNGCYDWTDSELCYYDLYILRWQWQLSGWIITLGNSIYWMPCTWWEIIFSSNNFRWCTTTNTRAKLNP